ncbi:HNH endonuclease signature motif containing protein [Microbacterium sp. CIAB417]|uniref:HNH endonuclease signature motif containing protein n=1 Tax=Microbacterium sp. CIAB417 TaxID=2860287 RepID=UPI001FAD3B62|nr:HNH endonuclease signature motif containing protein [Microbacterium sp. CIAB417]
MEDAAAMSPEDAEAAMLEGLLAGVEKTRASIAALEALELNLLATARQIAADRTSRLSDPSARAHEMPLRDIAAEFAAALHANDRGMQNELHDAADIARRLPRSLAALAEGRISRRHLRAIHEASAGLDGPELTAYDDRAAAAASEMSVNRLRPVLRRLAEQAQQRPLTERHREARTQRGVFVRDLPDGMAELTAVLPVIEAHGAHDRLTRMAHLVRDAHDPEADPRTIDQLRADILSDLLLTSTTADTADAPHAGIDAVRAHVRITIPATTLLGTTDAGAELVGVSPVDAETARRLAGGAAAWTRVLTHPVTGNVVGVDRYRPSEDQRRLLQVRDERCRFPGCRMPTHRCDIDHTVDWAHGGTTHVDNLAHLCRRHHSLKHATPWRVRLDPDGVLEWTSPHGRQHRDSPASRVVFTDAADPPF